MSWRIKDQFDRDVAALDAARCQLGCDLGWESFQHVGRDTASRGDVPFSQPGRSGGAGEHSVQDGKGVASSPADMLVLTLLQSVKFVYDDDRHKHVDGCLPDVDERAEVRCLQLLWVLDVEAGVGYDEIAVSRPPSDLAGQRLDRMVEGIHSLIQL